MGAINEGTGGGGGSAIGQFAMTPLCTIGGATKMEYSSEYSKIVLGTAAGAPGNIRGGTISGLPAYLSTAGAALAQTYGKFWYGGPAIDGRGSDGYPAIGAQAFPWYPPTGRHVYVTDDLSEIQKFNEFFAKLATWEEPPIGS